MTNREKFNSNLVKISVLHAVCFLASVCLVALAQLGTLPGPLSRPDSVFWITVSLFGYIGALLYFGRKCYVYHINDKFGALADEAPEDVLSGRLQGYYLYLISRPIAGIAIGPIAAMIVLGGISTISNQTTSDGIGLLSEVGRYIIYLAAFVGGYTSSDLFDALAAAGKRLLKPTR